MLNKHLWISRGVAIIICPVFLAGCTLNGTAENKVIEGSDGPTVIYLAQEDPKEDVKDQEPEEFLEGTWVTASQGYEYYETTQPMYYVRFDGRGIKYGHMKDGKIVLDRTDTIKSIDPSPGGYIVKAESKSKVQYTYRSSERDKDILNYYETWEEDDFPSSYRGGASLSRSNDETWED